MVADMHDKAKALGWGDPTVTLGGERVPVGTPEREAKDRLMVAAIAGDRRKRAAARAKLKSAFSFLFPENPANTGLREDRRELTSRNAMERARRATKKAKR